MRRSPAPVCLREANAEFDGLRRFTINGHEHLREIREINNRINDAFGSQLSGKKHLPDGRQQALLVPEWIITQGVAPVEHTANQFQSVVEPFRAEFQSGVLAVIVAQRDHAPALPHGPQGLAQRSVIPARFDGNIRAGSDEAARLNRRIALRGVERLRGPKTLCKLPASLPLGQRQ